VPIDTLIALSRHLVLRRGQPTIQTERDQPISDYRRWAQAYQQDWSIAYEAAFRQIPHAHTQYTGHLPFRRQAGEVRSYIMIQFITVPACQAGEFRGVFREILLRFALRQFSRIAFLNLRGTVPMTLFRRGRDGALFACLSFLDG
jgi:hypothetical protein